MTAPLSLPRGTVEYLQGSVNANLTLDTETVELSLSRGGVHTWLPATWVGTVGTKRTARTTAPVTLGDDYPHRSYSLYARVGSAPESPIIYVGSVQIPGTTDTEAPLVGDVVDGGSF